MFTRYQSANDLHHELLQLENCEEAVIKSLGRAGLFMQKLHLTPQMRQVCDQPGADFLILCSSLVRRFTA